MRSRIVLACAEGKSNICVAEGLGVSRPTVTKWRNRFAAMRLQGLLDEPPPGGRGNHDERARALLVLGRPFGATTDAPAGQSVADARWTWLAGRRPHRRLWEVKTGGAERVPRDWVDQLLGQMQVERHQWPNSVVMGCLLVQQDQLEPEAAVAAHDAVAVLKVEAVIRAAR